MLRFVGPKRPTGMVDRHAVESALKDRHTGHKIWLLKTGGHL